MANIPPKDTMMKYMGDSNEKVKQVVDNIC